jgi:predicted ATPase
VAQGLRLPGFDSLGGADEADRLARRLKPWQALLVLDNAEHLLTAVAGLAGSLLDHAPGVQLLVTSRARLGMAAEQAFEVTGLDIPADHQLPDARRFGAIALFESRARAAGARAPFTPGELADAVAICRELDGLPLALELAAARVPLLGVKGVKAGLDDRLRAFRDPARPLPGRQRSLHDTLAWSYALLRPAEQALLRALGLMVGSFSLPDAAAVAQAPGEDRWAFVERFDSLLRLNLLSFDPLRPQHWRLPATTRLFALQQLEACQEGAAARLRHAQACVQRYGQWDQDWYDGIRPEIEIDRAAGQSLGNLCAALDWACGKGGPRVLAAQLLAVSGRVLHLFGQRVRATAWADATVAALQDGLAPEQAARLLLAWASVPPSGGRQPAQRVDFIERAMAGLSAPADRLRLTAARVRASHYAALAGDPQRAVRHLQQAQDQQDPQDPPRLRAWVLALQDRHNLYFGLGSPPPEAQLQEVLEDLEACGDGQCQFAYGIRIVLGERHLLAGLVEQARDELDLLCLSAVADGRGAASALFAPYDTLASAELACGRLPEAQAAVRLALDAAQHVQAWNQAGLVLAWLLACQGRYRAAVELVAAIDIHLQRQQQQLEQVETLARRRALTEVAKACAPGDIARWQTAGAAWTPDGLARVMAGGDPRFAP